MENSGKESYPGKPIGQYTLDGELVACHTSVYAAAEETGVRYTRIAAALIGKQIVAGGFIWADTQQSARTRAEHRKATIKNKNRALVANKCKTVVQFSMSGKPMAVYVSTQAAGRATGIHQASISQAALGKIKQAGGFLWRYVVHPLLLQSKNNN